MSSKIPKKIIGDDLKRKEFIEFLLTSDLFYSIKENEIFYLKGVQGRVSLRIENSGYAGCQSFYRWYFRRAKENQIFSCEFETIFEEDFWNDLSEDSQTKILFSLDRFR